MRSKEDNKICNVKITCSALPPTPPNISHTETCDIAASIHAYVGRVLVNLGHGSEEVRINAEQLFSMREWIVQYLHKSFF